MSNDLLLINPWIYDFVAYDLWSKPLGLLYIASFLRNAGFKISFIDCLDRYHPGLNYLKEGKFGCGKYFYEEVEKPEVIKNIPRIYKRYGLPIEVFKKELKRIPKPRAILITSLMTYWYIGVQKVVKIIREEYDKNIPIILGGIYATLCYEHAKENSGADYVIKRADIRYLLELLFQITNKKRKVEEDYNLANFPYPAYDFYANKLRYVCMLTSFGCPYNCTYCAQSILQDNFYQRKVYEVIEEICFYYNEFRIPNIVFYDDALLVNNKKHINKILEGVIKKNIKCNFHTPNGIHVRFIDEELAELLFASGFKTLRLSLETTDENLQVKTGGKVFNKDFERAMKNLLKAGYKCYEIESYVLTGHPWQSYKDIERSILFASNWGSIVRLVEYSPIPGTKDWENIKRYYSFSENCDPLLHNNSVLFFQNRKEYQELKALVSEINLKARKEDKFYEKCIHEKCI
ncbi:MAG: radical SAM protein [bacterium]|nr:radical SAM protein [bacterium]